MPADIVSLHPASFGRRRDLAALPSYTPLPVGYVDFDSLAGVKAERLPCGWPVLPADVEIVTHADGRLAVRPVARPPAVIPADAPSPVAWLPRARATGWRGVLRRLFGRA